MASGRGRAARSGIDSHEARAVNVAQEKYAAVVFDLLTALLDSWSLWNEAAGSVAAGVAWRTRYLELTYQAGAYRSYEGIIKEAAAATAVPVGRADELIGRWGELRPWPEARQVLRALQEKVPVAVATNASIALAEAAVAALGVPIETVVTAEEAGYYKPHPRPYRMALERLGCAAPAVLFVAGSAVDVPGASAAGMTVFWHNRLRLGAADARVRPRYVAESLLPLLDLV
ncbi:MAG: HAD-IA family hydrolase [Planctomycetes bacterium]|nr:HAD-IA family hydrolase [Planctomycetota bacterium]